jgi:hypothetical protein
MNLEYKKRSLAAAWIVAVIAVALVAGVGAPMAWLVVSVVGFGPSIVVLHFWKQQPQTITQSIQEARR